MADYFYAHSENADGEFHSLVEHLESVARLAAKFCESYDAGKESAKIAFYTGLWHDVGKFNLDFQAYLRGELSKGPDHKAAGAKIALQHCRPVGLLVQGHPQVPNCELFDGKWSSEGWLTTIAITTRAWNFTSARPSCLARRSDVQRCYRFRVVNSTGTLLCSGCHTSSTTSTL